MKIRIKAYNGELPSYLTVGKAYSQVGVDHSYPDIIDDEGDKITVVMSGCAFLNGGS